MTLALRTQNFMPAKDEMEQMTNVCRILATCPYYSKLGPGGVLAIWLTAREMNLPPMMCLNGGMYTFSGVVSLSSQLMNMMIVNAGHRADVIHLDEKSCKIRFVRSDRSKGNADTFEYEFTIAMAEKAGYLRKDNWKNHPRDMLFSRTLSGGAKKFMPDVIMNAYVHGELEDDGHIIPLMPEIVQEKQTNEQPKQIEEQKKPQPTFQEIEAFKARFKFGEGSYEELYLKTLSDKLKKPEDEILACAIQNQEGFLVAMEKWKSKNIKKQEEVQEEINS